MDKERKYVKWRCTKCGCIVFSGTVRNHKCKNKMEKETRYEITEEGEKYLDKKLKEKETSLSEKREWGNGDYHEKDVREAVKRLRNKRRLCKCRKYHCWIIEDKDLAKEVGDKLT